MDDTISRAAALDAILKKPAWHNSDGSYYHSSDIKDALDALPSAQPYTTEEVQKMADLEQAEIEKAFELGREDAMSEIVRCKDCKHHQYDGNIPYCDNIDYGYGWYDNDFCSHAERWEE